MFRIITLFLFILFPAISSAQGVVRGTVYDKQQSAPLGFVTVQVQSQSSTAFVGGAMTDADGKFRSKRMSMASICPSIQNRL